MNKFQKVGKVMGAVNVGMSFVSMGFSIASAIRLADVQADLSKKKEK